MTRMKVAVAKARLSRDFFAVGLTEDMPSFLVLVALKLGWPMDYLCCAPRNVNRQVGLPREVYCQ